MPETRIKCDANVRKGLFLWRTQASSGFGDLDQRNWQKFGCGYSCA